MIYREISEFDGTPDEIDMMLNGPRPEQNSIEWKLAVKLLNQRYDEVQKALNMLLGVKNDKGGNK